MHFFNDGPDVPDNLLTAHEEGRVVFFCGAGISIPACLPSFLDLAKNIHEKNIISLNESYENNIDRAFQFLENKFLGGRKDLLENVWSELQFISENMPQKHYHDSLLTLSRSKSDGAIRLVTTNFDRIFQECESELNERPEALVAPRLPVPKPNRWDGIAYLHGLLPEEKNDLSKNDNIVITSGDFGQAYLIEGWAARFITELFRNYIVCFVGYSLNDPVMRYLTDALIKDEAEGMKFEERYIFLPNYDEKQTEKDNIEWSERGISAIYYKINKMEHNHTYLERTLTEWASGYRNGSDAKKNIIHQYLSLKIPGNISTARILWALKDPLVVQYFANMDPCPPISNIDLLSGMYFKYKDLPSFGHRLLPNKKPENFPDFSMLCQKAKFEEAQFISPFVEHENYFFDKNSSIEHFNKWITRHLDKPYLAIWMASQNKPLGNTLKQLIIVALEKDRNSSKGIHGSMMKIWALFLSDSVMLHKIGNEMYEWIQMRKKLKIYGLTPTIKSELKTLLKPVLHLNTLPSSYKQEPEIKNEIANKSIFKQINFYVDTGYENFSYDIPDTSFFGTSQNGKISLDDSMFYFQLLTDALTDMFVLIKWVCDNELDWWLNHKISNLNNFGKLVNWTSLVINLQILWLKIADGNKEESLNLLGKWSTSPHLVFNRLFMLIISKNSDYFEADYVYKHLIANNEYLLLSNYSEKLSLFSKFKNKFNNFQLNNITRILISPVENINLPTDFPQDTLHSDEKFANDIEKHFRPHQNVLISLKNLKEGNTNLPQDAIVQLSKYQACKSFEFYFKALQQQKFEFPNITSSIDNWLDYFAIPEKLIDDYKSSKLDSNLRKRKELPDQWKLLCKKRPIKAFKLLFLLHEKGCWKIDKCVTMLDCWSEIMRQSNNQDIMISERKKSFYIQSLSCLYELEVNYFTDICWSIISLTQELISLFIDMNMDEVLLKFTDKVIITSTNNSSPMRDIIQPFNHPVGMATQTLITYQYKKHQIHKNGLLNEVKKRLNTILDGNESKYDFGIAIITRYINELYLFDQKWSEEKLLPFFKWENHIKEKEKTKAAWIGYFSKPGWSFDLLKQFQYSLLDTVNHLVDFNQNDNIYSSIICTIALDQIGIKDKNNRIFIDENLVSCIKLMPGIQRSNMIQIISQKLEDVSYDPEIYWDEVVKPFFKEIWPGEKETWDDEMQRYFECIILASRHKFPEAVDLFYSWLVYGRDLRNSSHYASPLISGLAKNISLEKKRIIDAEPSSIDKSNYFLAYPDDSFRLLDATINQHSILFSDQQRILLNFLNSPSIEKYRGSPAFNRLSLLANKP